MSPRILALAVLTFVLVMVFHTGAASNPCESDADCTGGQRCVEHFNFASSSSCNLVKYCIDVSDTSCSCEDGLACRLKDCPDSPYECVFVENEDTRCGGSKAPKCSCKEICAYNTTGLNCIRCPCYGTHEAVCVPRDPKVPCGVNSIAFVSSTGGYTCEGCASATSVLTA